MNIENLKLADLWTIYKIYEKDTKFCEQLLPFITKQLSQAELDQLSSEEFELIMKKILSDKNLRKTFIEMFSESAVVFNLRGYQLTSIYRVIWRQINSLSEAEITPLLKTLQQASCQYLHLDETRRALEFQSEMMTIHQRIPIVDMQFFKLLLKRSIHQAKLEGFNSDFIDAPNFNIFKLNT